MRISDWSSDVCSSDLGTLYGANSLGGLVRIVSRRPQLDEFSGLATAEGTSVDGGGQGYAFRGALNVPIVRVQLAIRINGVYRRAPGWTDHVFLGPQHVPANHINTRPRARRPEHREPSKP